MTKWYDVPTLRRFARILTAKVRQDIALRYPSVVIEVSPPFLKLFRVVKNKEKANSFVWAIRNLDKEVAESKMLDFEIRRPGELAREIERMLESSGSITDSISVLFPESAARVVFIDIESFPRDKKEQFDMIRWKLSGKLPYSVDLARIAYEIHYEQDGKARVMACAVKDSSIKAIEEVFGILGIEAGFVTPSFFSLLSFQMIQEPTLHIRATPVSTAVALTEGDKVKLYRIKARADAEAFLRDLRATLLYIREELAVENISSCYTAEEGDEPLLSLSEITSMLDMPVSAYPWPESFDGGQTADGDTKMRLLPLAWFAKISGAGL